MLNRSFTQIVKQTPSQRIANTAKKVFLDIAKESNPAISQFIERTSTIDSMPNTPMKQRQYENLYASISNNDIETQSQLYSTIAKAEYLSKAVEISHQVRNSSQKEGAMRESSLITQKQETEHDQLLRQRVIDFTKVPVNNEIRTQAQTIADSVALDRGNGTTLKNMLKQYAALPLESESQFMRSSYDFHQESDFEIADLTYFNSTEEDRQIVPSPHEIKHYVQSQLFESISKDGMEGESSQKSRNILFRAVRTAIDSKNETISEFKDILAEAEDGLSSEILRKIKDRKQNDAPIDLTLNNDQSRKIVNETRNQLEQITQYYQTHAEGAELELYGSHDSLFNPPSISFSNLPISQSRMKNRIEIEKKRQEYTSSTGFPALEDSESSRSETATSLLRTKIDGFYKELKKGNIPTSKNLWDTMKFTDAVVRATAVPSYKEKRSSYEKDCTNLPKALEQLSQNQRER